MEKRDARLFQQTPELEKNDGWNIVELESRRQLRRKINALIALATNGTIVTSEMRQHLLLGVATFGTHFATQLVRSLQRDNQTERQSIVWLLTLLNEQETIAPLQSMQHNKRLSRPIRLSAALALAGMGVTEEMRADYGQRRMYAIS